MKQSNPYQKTKVAVVVVTLLLLAVAMSLRFFTPAYIISSGSMAPTIAVGEVVVTVPVDQLNTTDIISFHHKGAVTVHTFLGYGADDSLMTKGDANETPDAFDVPLQKSDVIGKVVLHFAPWKLWALTTIVLGTVLVIGLSDWRRKQTLLDEQTVPEDISAHHPV